MYVRAGLPCVVVKYTASNGLPGIVVIDTQSPLFGAVLDLFHHFFLALPPQVTTDLLLSFAELTYASSSWWGFTTASEIRVNVKSTLA